MSGAKDLGKDRQAKRIVETIDNFKASLKEEGVEVDDITFEMTEMGGVSVLGLSVAPTRPTIKSFTVKTELC